MTQPAAAHAAQGTGLSSASPTPAGLSVEQLGKHYGDTTVFAQVSFTVAPGEFVAIVGDSGVGKSTLLNCLAGLDTWDTGRITHGSTDLGLLDDTQRALWRRANVGFVFQAFHVLPHLDVAQNVALPLMLLGRPDPARIEHMLDAVGLADLGRRLPQQLSGGQLQRVAIARALVHRPALLLADEPTGNLD
ncbi:MAG: ABC transporter ATP-binding protein, partial [Comamonadaceae bacterium]